MSFKISVKYVGGDPVDDNSIMQNKVREPSNDLPNSISKVIYWSEFDMKWAKIYKKISHVYIKVAHSYVWIKWFLINKK